MRVRESAAQLLRAPRATRSSIAVACGSRERSTRGGSVARSVCRPAALLSFTMCQAASSSPSSSLPFLPPFTLVLSSAELAPSDAWCACANPNRAHKGDIRVVWRSRGPSVQWPNTNARQRRATARYLRAVGYRRGRFGETERTHTSAPTYRGTRLYTRLVHTSELSIIGDN